MLFRERLKSGKALLGPFVNLCHPAIMEIAGLAGFDFAIIDTEHGEISTDRALDMIRAAQLSGVSPIIRVYGNQPELIGKALDMGAEGVQIPMVCDKAGAAAALGAARFSPAGSRGCNRFVRAARYSHMGKDEFFGRSNDRTSVLVQVEGKEGLDNLEEILAVPGIDVLFIGPYDLSASLGIPGQVEHPLLLAAMDKTLALAQKAGVALGFFVDDIPTAIKWKNRGIRYIAFSADVSLLYEAFAQKVKEFHAG
ncbi:MAG: aldolase [Deltaproteobacteria bacterium]|jgi:4-hydroxy-2-oxoheptanedioate aldolase|nr:aldolase [Deltaproteobacteria bacterium]